MKPQPLQCAGPASWTLCALALTGGVLSSTPRTVAYAPVARADRMLAGMAPLFVANRGQATGPGDFLVLGRDKALAFHERGFTLALAAAPGPAGPDRPAAAPARHGLHVEFADARPVQPSGLDRKVTRMSWFRGLPDRWITGVPTYGGVFYREAWPGIDAVYRGETGRIKGEYVVAPGADSGRVRLRYRGATALRVDSDGGLRVETPLGVLTDPAPVAYQDVRGERRPVSCAYDLRGDTCGFRLGDYDRALPLVIDPVVVIYCGFIGGAGADALPLPGYGWIPAYQSGIIAVDSGGAVYVAGGTTSTAASFPVTPGSFGPADAGNGDAFVAKVSPDGSTLLYCGFLGGEGTDAATAVTVDNAGRAYVTGWTYSDNRTFPVSVGPRTALDGTRNGFVARLNPQGTGLEYCGYVGTQYALGTGVAVDDAGAAYVCGTSWLYAAFVARVNPTGGSLDYFGLLPWIPYGPDNLARDIVVDGDGNGYVCGFHDPDDSGTRVGWLARVKPAAVAAEYLRAWPDDPRSVDMDADGAAYVGMYVDATAESLVVKVAPDGLAETYSYRLPGAQLADVAVDTAGRACFTGNAWQPLPTTGGPDDTWNGGWDAFAARLTPAGDGLEFLGYIGGAGEDYGVGIVADATGSIYVGGFTNSGGDTFPVRTGPSLDPGGAFDVFVAKVGDLTPPPAPAGLTAEALSSSRILVRWQPVAPAPDGYRLEQSIDGGPFAVLPDLPPDATQYTAAGLDPATLYTYRIRAFNAAGTSAYSNEAATVTPMLEAPALMAVASELPSAASAILRVTWVDLCESESRFLVECAVNGGPFEQVWETPPSGGLGARVSWLHTGLEWTTLYTYRVRVQDAAGRFSPYSNELGAYASLVASPSDLSARPLSAVRARLTWTDNAAGESAFHVERATGDGPYSEIARRESQPGVGEPVSYIDSPVSPGTQYRYRVRARRGPGYSPYSNEAVLVPEPVPATPTGLQVTRFTLSLRRAEFVDQAGNEDGFILYVGWPPGPGRPPRTRRSWDIPRSPGTGRNVTFDIPWRYGGSPISYRIEAYRLDGGRLRGPSSAWVGETIVGP